MDAIATYKFVRNQYRDWVSTQLNKRFATQLNIGYGLPNQRSRSEFYRTYENICESELESFISIPKTTKRLYVTAYTGKPRSMSNVLEVKLDRHAYQAMVRGATRKFKRTNVYLSTYLAIAAALGEYDVKQLYLAFEYE